MSLDLNPQTETILRVEAAREGVSIDDLIRRTFGKAEPQSPVTEDPDKQRVFALLRERQREYGLPVPPGGYKPLGELFAEWNAEDAKMTNEEREEERRFWEDYERGRNERPLQI